MPRRLFELIGVWGGFNQINTSLNCRLTKLKLSYTEMIMTEVYENLGYGLVHAQIVTVLNRLMETLHLHPVKIISLALFFARSSVRLHFVNASPLRSLVS
jgi:hypothetical protein